MKVLWFTARSFTDLCSTTQQALIRGLLDNGFELQLINGDLHPPMEQEGFSHIPLPTSARRGFQASFLAKNMVAWLKENPIEPSTTVALVEWRIARRITPWLNKFGIRWMLIDRSPPADSGPLGWLQWSVWKGAWKQAKNQGRLGCVVSLAHQRFVDEKTGHKETIILPAGVDLHLFKPGIKHEILTMVYHGQLDRHRGIMAAVMLVHKARQEGIQVNLKLIGEGNVYQSLKRITSEFTYIDVQPKANQTKVAEEIGACHIGLLPMPKRTVWTLASPLKRSEYLAAGLCVFGVDHEGHQLKKQKPWFVLANQEDFHSAGLEYLRSFSTTDKVQANEVRQFAEQNFGWDITTSNLIQAIQRAMADS